MALTTLFHPRAGAGLCGWTLVMNGVNPTPFPGPLALFPQSLGWAGKRGASESLCLF